MVRANPAVAAALEGAEARLRYSLTVWARHVLEYLLVAPPEDPQTEACDEALVQALCRAQESLQELEEAPGTERAIRALRVRVRLGHLHEAWLASTRARRDRTPADATLP